MTTAHPPLSSKPVTLVGAGSMGRLIALSLATRGGVVRLHDPNPDALANAVDFLASYLDGAVAMLTAKSEGHVAATIETYDDMATAVAGAGLVIETATEDLALKRTLLRELDVLADPEAIVASNSSSIPVSAFLADLVRPDRVLNLHFHNPPHAPAVDLLSSGSTRREIIDHLEQELPKYGLVPFEAVSQTSGFPFNRLIEGMIREALQIVVDGASTPEKVDGIWMVDTGMPWGPFGLMDQIGLDVVADIERLRRQHNPTFEQWDAVEVLEPYISAGKLGVKTGEGFYRYDADGKRIS